MIDEMKSQTEKLFRRTVEEYEPFNIKLLNVKKEQDEYITVTAAIFEENFIINACKLLCIQHPQDKHSANDCVFIKFTPKEDGIYYKVYGRTDKAYSSVMFKDTYNTEGGLSDVTLIWFKPILRKLVRNKIKKGKYLSDNMFATAYCQIWTNNGLDRQIYAYEPFWKYDRE